jgi:hypothetical protein
VWQLKISAQVKNGTFLGPLSAQLGQINSPLIFAVFISKLADR